jgi:hypothetical protein
MDESRKLLSFKEFTLSERTRYPSWAKVGTVALVAKIRSLTVKIKNETDLATKLDLIAQQNSLISYLVGGGLVVNKR